MPKVELHLHLEGTLSPDVIATIATRNQLEYFSSAEEVRRSLQDRPPGLMGFLQHHFKSQEVMLTRRDFEDATYDLVKNLHNNNVVYAEIFFDPQAHTSRGIAFKDIVEGIDAGRIAGAKEFGVQLNLIMCINRERSVASAFQMLDQAAPFKDLILGLGLDSGPEYGNPPIKFKEVYDRARDEGYKLTAHADVDVRDTLVHIRQLLDVVKVDRIDHGLNSIEDHQIIRDLVNRKMCLTGSPIKRKSDPKLQDIDRIVALDKQGVCVSMHTDDPEEFESGYLNSMMKKFAHGSGYSKNDMTRLVYNAYRAMWLPVPEQQIFINSLKNYAERNGVDWSAVTSQQHAL
jgi:adenosine deaminase